MPRFHFIDKQTESDLPTEDDLMVLASPYVNPAVTRYPDGSISVDVRAARSWAELEKLASLEASPAPASAPARGRPKLEVKKTRAEIQRDYRARKGISSVSLPADDVLPLIAALQAASACPMLKAEDRLVLSGLLSKLGG